MEYVPLNGTKPALYAGSPQRQPAPTPEGFFCRNHICPSVISGLKSINRYDEFCTVACYQLYWKSGMLDQAYLAEAKINANR